MCGRVIQSSGPRRYAIVYGMNVRNSRVHKHPPAVERGSEPRADFGIDDLLDGRSKIFVRTRSKRCQEALGAASRSEKKTALTLDHSARLGRERALRADPWSIIDSVAAEIILHGKSADER